ncbi:hypothetical protein E2C01_093752 [Portunus trituberculatus]|uniref:Uncharacterized protein n=1 Tax=Portunus trituberculatus TaxID=210409 RepID=A0A5B7JQM8_PORTR|nr:hypothetical protein [Portunus trituberculatus]
MSSAASSDVCHVTAKHGRHEEAVMGLGMRRDEAEQDDRFSGVEMPCHSTSSLGFTAPEGSDSLIRHTEEFFSEMWIESLNGKQVTESSFP